MERGEKPHIYLSGLSLSLGLGGRGRGNTGIRETPKKPGLRPTSRHFSKPPPSMALWAPWCSSSGCSASP